MTATLIWLACVGVAWTHATGDVVGYNTETSIVSTSQVLATARVNTNQYRACAPMKYEPVAFRVQGFNAEGDTGPWSDPLVLARVHNFDPDGDGVIGWLDWVRFVGAFGCRYRASGLAVCP